MFQNLFDSSKSDDDQDPLKKKRSAEVQPSSMVTTDGKVGGYKYQDAPIPDIIAYCFGGEKNQEKLKNIIDDAEKIDDKIKKKTFIEKQVRAHAGEIDKGIGGGMIDFFSKAQQQYQQDLKEGKINEGQKITIEPAQENRAEDGMFQVMRGLGLNIDSSNCTTTYQQGPGGYPKVFTMVFVNRPTQEMKDPNSLQNNLAGVYKDTLDGQEKSDFESKIAKHVDDAKDGGPKIAIDQFKDQANKASDQAFSEAVKSAVTPDLKQVASALRDGKSNVGDSSIITGIRPADLSAGMKNGKVGSR
jgi:hypothetical protein